MSSALQVRRFALFPALMGVVLMAACTPAPPAAGINDPYEATNRKVHEANKRRDTKFLRPLGVAYHETVPQPVAMGVANFADNVGTPKLVVNNILQADAEGAILNSLRFALNTTIGIGGLFDVADGMGIPEHDTDFGETLHVWGAPEGAYLELPWLGPSTERDTVGKFVDLFTDPLGYVVPSPEKYTGTAARIAKRIGDRGKYAQTIDSVLYDSADSYAQGRITYLQNRRYELSDDAGLADPYDDPYGATDDPHDDPYAE